MKRFLFTIAIALAAAFTMPVYAGGINSNAVGSAGWDKLSEAQKADVLSSVAKAAEGSGLGSGAGAVATAVATSTPQKVSEWVDVGTKIGQGIGGAAKEVGIAVNEFVKTPVGMAVMGIFVWKFMGGVIVHVVGGVLVWLFGFGFVIYLQRITCRITKEYGEPRTLLGFIPIGRPVTKYVRDVPRDREGDVDSGYVAAWILCYGVVLMLGLITIFSY